MTSDDGGGALTFNLGVPEGQDYTQLFGTSLAAAGTPLSTVVALFLLNGGILGLRLLLCPLFFAVGMYVTYWVYLKAKSNGYFSGGTAPNRYGYVGLVPFLGKTLTGSANVGYAIVALCALPLIGLLTLEIAFGIQIIEYITAGAFQISEDIKWRAFFIFAIFIVLLLGYVFVGGFRAVLRSDVWQYKLIQVAVVLTLATLFVLSFQKHLKPDWALLWPKQENPVLVGFYVPVIFVNLVLPMGLISSWQRFRAFEYIGVDIRRALLSGLRRTALLWIGLIAVGLYLVIFRIDSAGSSLASLFDALQNQGAWCQYFVFPILTVAALSAMYSCSDTCVSALLYLIEYAQSGKPNRQSMTRLSSNYYWAMGLILVMTLVSYWFLRIRYPQDINAAPLFRIAVALYANLSVLAPTLVLTAFLPPALSGAQMTQRTRYIMISLLFGSTIFWGCLLLGFRNPLWAQCATVPALLSSALPVWLLFRRERRTLRSDLYDRRNYSVRGTGTLG
jgi:hypothetical protein